MVRGFGKKLAVAAGVSLVLVASLLTAPAAYAAPENNCASGATCAWRDHTYLTAGSASSKIAFQQCVSDYFSLKYSGTNIGGSEPISVYNNGNYDAVYVYVNSGYDIGGPTTSLFRRTLQKKTGDGNVTNDKGYIANFASLGSGRFVTVAESCTN
ncbi:hypothetical protein [Microbacterium sp. GXF0217]